MFRVTLKSEIPDVDGVVVRMKALPTPGVPFDLRLTLGRRRPKIFRLIVYGFDACFQTGEPAKFAAHVMRRA